MVVVAEDEVGEHGERSAELGGIRRTELGWDAGRGPGRGREEEPRDREVERPGEGDDLVGIELPDPVAVDAALGGREAGLGPAPAEVGLERLGGLLLGPALQRAGLGEVVGDDLVRGEPEIQGHLRLDWLSSPARHESTIAQTNRLVH